LLHKLIIWLTNNAHTHTKIHTHYISRVVSMYVLL